MKTEQEQIKAIKQIIDERVETTLGQVQGRHDNVIKTVDTIIIARDIVNAGYGKVSEYKAEREMLGSQIKVLKQRLNDKYIEVDNLNRDYSNAFERLKAQGREIKKLKEEKKRAQIDVLNNVKDVLANQKHECLERNNLTGYSAICDCEKYIDELIKEVENEQ